MYKSKRGTAIQFKPKNMLIEGNVYYIDSQETLDKIKSNLELKKQIELDNIEEEKNQKVLIRRIKNKGREDKIIKTIKTIEQVVEEEKMIQVEREKRMQMLANNNQPKLTLITPRNRKVIEHIKNITSNDKVAIDEHIDQTIQTEYTQSNPQEFNVIRKQRRQIKDLNNNGNNQSDSADNVFMEPNKLHDMMDPQYSDDELTTHKSKSNSNSKNSGVDNDDAPIKTEAVPLKVLNANVRKTASKLQRVNKGVCNYQNRRNEQNEQNRQNEQNMQNMQNEQQYNAPNKQQSPHDGLYISKRLPVKPFQWYMMMIECNTEDKGLIKIMDSENKSIVPTIKLNNAMFLQTQSNDTKTYGVYFITQENDEINFHILGLTIYNFNVVETSKNLILKNIDLWKFRKMYDLEFIDYYIKTLNMAPKFINEFVAEYMLYENPHCFDEYMKTYECAKNNNDTIVNNFSESIIQNVLFIIEPSIENIQNGYISRVYNLMCKLDQQKYNVLCATTSHVSNNENDIIMPNGSTIKLYQLSDNTHDNNIVDNIKNYINSIVTFSIEHNIKIICVCNNFINGMASYYASKYLGIKFAYDTNELYVDSMTAINSNFENSNLYKMILSLEKIIIDNADYLIVSNDIAKGRLTEYNIEPHRISVVNGIANESFDLADPDGPVNFRVECGILDTDILIGYIGPIQKHENIETILNLMVKIDMDNVKLLLIGTGTYLSELNRLIDEFGIRERVIYIHMDKSIYANIFTYYSAIDIAIYPKSNDQTCKHNYNYNYILLEMLKMSKLVILPDFDIYKQITNDGFMYYVPNNIDDLIGKFKLLINDRQLQNKLQENAKKYMINETSDLDFF